MSEQESTLDEFVENETNEVENKIAPPTELRNLPENWTATRLDDVAEDTDGSFVDGPFGSNLKADEMFDNGFARIVQLQNIRISEFIDSNHKYISEKKFKQLERHGAKPGDLAIAKMAEPVARACLLPEIESQYLVVADCIKLTVNRSKHNSKFVMFALNSTPVWKQAFARSRGSTRKRINLTQLKEVQIPSPSLPEQRKIATVLHTVDQAIEKTEEIIDREMRIRKGLHQKLFRDWSNETNTDPLVGKYPADWELKTLSDVVTITDAEHFTPDYVESGIPVLRPGDLTPGPISLENVNKRVDEDTYQKLISRHTPSNRDIVYSRSQNFAVASQVIEDEPFCLGQDMVVIEPNMLDETFLLHLLNSPIVRNQAVRRSTGSTFSRVNLGDIRSYKVPIPSEEVQQNIAEIIVGVEEQIRVEQETQSQLNRLKGALVQDLLSGTVRTTDTNITVPDEVAQHG